MNQKRNVPSSNGARKNVALGSKISWKGLCRFSIATSLCYCSSVEIKGKAITHTEVPQVVNTKQKDVYVSIKKLVGVSI